MHISKNYIANGSVTVEGLVVTPNDVVILTGVQYSTAVRSLELVNKGDYDAVVHIKRTTSANVVYQDIKVDLGPGQYFLLWDELRVINEGHKLILSSDNNDVQCSVNVYEGFYTE